MPFSPKQKKRLRQDTYVAATELVKSRVAIFTEKKAPAARYIAARGLVKSWGGHFRRKKKAPAARYIAATELVKVRIMAASWVSTTIR